MNLLAKFGQLSEGRKPSLIFVISSITYLLFGNEYMSKLIEFSRPWLQKGKQPLAKDGVEPSLSHAQEVIDPIEMQPESRSSMTAPMLTLRIKEGKIEERRNQGRKHHKLLE